MMEKRNRKKPLHKNKDKDKEDKDDENKEDSNYSEENEEIDERLITSIKNEMSLSRLSTVVYKLSDLISINSNEIRI